MQNIIQKTFSQILMLVGLFLISIPSTVQSACVAPLIVDGLLLTPAAIGSYGTYKTLTDEPTLLGGNAFALACTRFYNAIAQTDSEHISPYIRAFLMNFNKCFKPHEKMAMGGSYVALLLGAGLTSVGFVRSLARCYKYLKATDEEKDMRKQELISAFNLLSTGMLSTVVGAVSMMLLVDYAESGMQHTSCI